jgi:hypothetical protein
MLNENKTTGHIRLRGRGLASMREALDLTSSTTNLKSFINKKINF